ncbi:glycosyltransferase [Microbacterium marmarense]|uniref:D-inositol 3-phosphate glycosyltransferase n=1 Tax=Microbacterium marmarense TaxID=3122051 RepID=A0ABU8LPD7_9MICO
MHIVMFGDQHLESLGGAQVSMRLQRRFLEKAGHTVTVVAPAMHGARARLVVDGAYVDMPSVPITPDREYSLTWPSRRNDRWVDAALARRPAVDVVHIQADFWGAFIGHRFAARHQLPVVHTMHNRVDVGIEATAPFPALVLRALNAWQRRVLRLTEPKPRGHDGWALLRRFALRSDAVTAPSAHFAERLEAHGVVPGGSVGASRRRALNAPHVDVVWNGIDDEMLADVLAEASTARESGRPRFVWLGRMSPEKRLLPFLTALAASGADAEVEIIGGGAERHAAERLVAKHGLEDAVTFCGKLPYAQVLRRIAAADAVVQTSIGFETQGMTVFEAASLGTPAIVCDPDIARELGSGYWAVAETARAARTVSALAGALRVAAAEIAAGTPVKVDPGVREKFRQSSRTAAMVEVYERVTG